MRISTLFVLAAVALTLSAAPASGAPKPNPHNSGDCLFCHLEAPVFGIDTLNSVKFREGVTVDDPALCLRCHKPEENIHPVGIAAEGGALGTRKPEILPLGTSAGLAGKVVCTTCHFMHASNADRSLLRGFPGAPRPTPFATWQELCRQCHGDGLAKRSPHAGDERACRFCHAAVPKKGQQAAVAAKGVELCNFCHGGLQNNHYAKANPFGKDASCPDCHDPHLGADAPARLKGSYIEAVKKVVTVSPHYREVFCFACHAEKKGEKYPLLTDDPIALCNRCHGTGEIVGDPHPLAKAKEDSRTKIMKGWPTAKDGSLTCLTCHRAGHKADKPFTMFLRGGPYTDRNDVCFSCHDKADFKGRNPHQDINQLKGCEFCHAVKPVPGKDTARTVKFLAAIPVLCLRCHEENPHPSGVEHTVLPSPEKAKLIPAEYPLDNEGKLTCATCHNPHILEVENDKLRGGEGGMEICGKCHKY
jgi:predicted CXXCH cytochrome family protein